MVDDLAEVDPRLLALLTKAGDEWGPLGVALVAARLTDPQVVATRLTCKPHLGLATTRELLAEITTRIEVDGACGGGGLDYSTVGGGRVVR